jgi:carboxyl-terminal processing protease
MDEEDEEAEEDEAESPAAAAAKKEKAKADTTTYRTKGGRIVFGGGGIVPDTIVMKKIPEAPIRALYGKDLFFQFANNEYVRLQKRGVKLAPDNQPDEATMKAFYAHLDSVEFTFQSIAQLHFDEFKKRSGIMEDTAMKEKDNPFMAPPKFEDAEFKNLVSASERVDSILAADSRHALRRNEPEIKRLIRDALLVREFGQDNEAVFRSKLANDEQFAVAMQILHNKNAYAALLKPKPAAVQKPPAATPGKDKKGGDNKKK